MVGGPWAIDWYDISGFKGHLSIQGMIWCFIVQRIGGVHYWYIWSPYSSAFAPSMCTSKTALGADQGVFQFFFSWDKGPNGYLYVSFHFFPDQILALFSFRCSFIYHESHDVTDCCFSNRTTRAVLPYRGDVYIYSPISRLGSWWLDWLLVQTEVMLIFHTQIYGGLGMSYSND